MIDKKRRLMVQNQEWRLLEDVAGVSTLYLYLSQCQLSGILRPRDLFHGGKMGAFFNGHLKEEVGRKEED
jgi:hypothetical protein